MVKNRAFCEQIEQVVETEILVKYQTFLEKSIFWWKNEIFIKNRNFGQNKFRFYLFNIIFSFRVVPFIPGFVELHVRVFRNYVGQNWVNRRLSRYRIITRQLIGRINRMKRSRSMTGPIWTWPWTRNWMTKWKRWSCARRTRNYIRKCIQWRVTPFWLLKWD